MLTEGLTDLCEGLMCIRQQNSAVVGIALTVVLFNERTNAQLERILRKLLSDTFGGGTVLRTAQRQFYDFVFKSKSYDPY